MRVFVAMVPHETNTFTTIPTDRGQFEARDLRYGGEILEACRATGTCLGGMIEVAAQRGLTLVPSGAASASPAGRMTTEVTSTIHYRAACEPLAHAIGEVDAPGLSSSNLARFDFRRVRRPLFPLDDLWATTVEPRRPPCRPLPSAPPTSRCSRSPGSPSA